MPIVVHGRNGDKPQPIVPAVPTPKSRRAPMAAAAAMGETEVTLVCVGCGKEAVALVGPADPTRQPVPWTCPHCHTVAVRNFGGRLFWVVRRDQRPNTDD
jgi:hypothetical protein